MLAGQAQQSQVVMCSKDLNALYWLSACVSRIQTYSLYILLILSCITFS